MNLSGFMQNIFALLYKHHASVSSWGRTAKHNKYVGGHPDSYHMLWCGCDVVLDDNTPNPAFVADAKLMGINAIWEGDHYHLQPLGW